MKCKRCGHEIEKLGHCQFCKNEEAKERRAVNWSLLKNMRLFIAKDEEIEQKYKDAGKAE